VDTERGQEVQKGVESVQANRRCGKDGAFYRVSRGKSKEEVEE